STAAQTTRLSGRRRTSPASPVVAAAIYSEVNEADGAAADPTRIAGSADHASAAATALPEACTNADDSDHMVEADVEEGQGNATMPLEPAQSTGSQVIESERRGLEEEHAEQQPSASATTSTSAAGTCSAAVESAEKV
ncbi:unnamed protein product, partial [Amoebophrya sp. A25]